MILKMADNFTDHALRVPAKMRVQEIVILPWPVESRSSRIGVSRIIWIIKVGHGAGVGHCDFGMLLVQPSGYGIGWSAKNGLDAGAVKAIKYALHPSKLKISIAW